MTHNQSVKTFNDIEHHLELKPECLRAAKLSDRVYMVESSLYKASSFKRKRAHKYNQKGKRSNTDKKKLDAKKYPKGMRAGKKKDKTKMKCYNCS